MAWSLLVSDDGDGVMAISKLISWGIAAKSLATAAAEETVDAEEDEEEEDGEEEETVAPTAEGNSSSDRGHSSPISMGSSTALSFLSLFLSLFLLPLLNNGVVAFSALSREEGNICADEKIL